MFKRIKTIILLLFVALPLSVSASEQEEPAKHIMLFMCQYGSGHKMATQGIVESLSEYRVQVVDMYEGPLQALDPMRHLAPALHEKLYNNMAQKEYTHLLNFVGTIGPKAFQMQHKKVEKLLFNAIAKDHPDMIISCIPLVTPMLVSVTKKLNIPLLIVTTDIDIAAFCYGLEEQKGKLDKTRFRITVPYAEKEWKEKFGAKYGANLTPLIHHALVYNFGYPTRRAFSESIPETTLQELRREYEIQEDEHVILVMMGGHTAQAAKAYATLLLSMSDAEMAQITGEGEEGGESTRHKIRLLCLCGDIAQKANHTLMESLNELNQSEIRKNTRVSICAKPGTSKIAELVSLPELSCVISKPGGSTVNEMIKKKIPMIYHVSYVPLDWERGNMEYGTSRALGYPFKLGRKINEQTRIKLLHTLKKSFLLRKELLSGKKAVPEAEIDFAANLKAAVSEMLE